MPLPRFVLSALQGKSSSICRDSHTDTHGKPIAHTSEIRWTRKLRH